MITRINLNPLINVTISYNLFLSGADCVQASNAQVWTELINGIYIADPSLTTCGSGITSFRQLGGSSVIWVQVTNTYIWIGTTVLCIESNSVKQFYGYDDAAANSPGLVPQSQFREQNSARNGWLDTQAMTITAVTCGEITFLYFSLCCRSHFNYLPICKTQHIFLLLVMQVQ